VAKLTVDILPDLPPEYDAIVVGGGHDRLATAAYLGRAGQKTLVLERARGSGRPISCVATTIVTRPRPGPA